MRALILILLLTFKLLPSAFCQDAAPGVPPPLNPLETTVESLEALGASIQAKRDEVQSLQQQLQTALDEVTRKEVLEKLESLKAQLGGIEQKFDDFAVVVDTSLYAEAKDDEGFNWQSEVGKLLQPILAEVRNATAETRKIGLLREEAEFFHERYAVSAKAVDNLERLLQQELSPALKADLEKRLTIWTARRDDAENQGKAAQLQLEQLLAERKSLLDSTTGYAQTFARTRGLNLLLGIGAFLGVFFGVRLIGLVLKKTRRKKSEKNFTSRLTQLLIHVFSMLGALGGMLLVFNMVGDWFLLGIIVIFLIGLGWASINTLPQHMETIKLMLNIGAIKEGERLVLDGVPWQVDALSFQAKLVNPLLDGGVQSLPVKYLVGKYSRPLGENEELFPSRQGDWVELADGRRGRVTYQTPGMVQLTELGGSQVVYQTPDYLAQRPRNLSTNVRVTSTFGIDYKHQNKATTEIPEKMCALLEEHLSEVIDPADIHHVDVRFRRAAASALEYQIRVDIKGSAASKFEDVQFAIQRILVDACNQHGWEIPFDQVTLSRRGL